MLKKIQLLKALEIEVKKQNGPLSINEESSGYYLIKEKLSRPGVSIIAEVAGGNPLRGQVRFSYRALTHAKGLVDSGADIISVATDQFLFYGDDRYLVDIHGHIKVPLIRRDFIFEEYQIDESKILGADGICLMAYLLDLDRLVMLQRLAKERSLDVIIEVANEEDLKRAIDAEAEIICVLGRDLNTWQADLQSALPLLEAIPKNKCLSMVEAGIHDLYEIHQLAKLSVNGVIIGDALLDDFYPGKRLTQILSNYYMPNQEIKSITN